MKPLNAIQLSALGLNPYDAAFLVAVARHSFKQDGTLRAWIQKGHAAWAKEINCSQGKASTLLNSLTERGLIERRTVPGEPLRYRWLQVRLSQTGVRVVRGQKKTVAQLLKAPKRRPSRTHPWKRKKAVGRGR